MRDPDGPGPPHRGRLILLLVLLVQVALMLGAFNPVPHSGGDNAGYLTLAHSLLERGAYLDLHDPAEPGHAKYPPVFPLILAGLMGLGARTWLAFKTVPAVFTTLSVVFAFAWVRERRGALFAGGVAVILALSDAFLWSSQWILSDPPFVAFTLLALWALERASAPLPDVEPPDRDGTEAQVAREGRFRPTGSTPWLALGAAAAILAYFTRSAGLPLVAAVALWLALGRRWRALAAFGAAFAVPAGLWWVRGLGLTEGPYLSEFLLLDPYQPALGRAGPADLAARVLENLRGYVGTHVPGGLTGLSGPPVAALGIATVLLALLGWGRRVLRGPKPAELFLPLYAGLVLLWPVVWSGDRFALPLLPLLLFYAGDALLWLGERPPELAWVRRGAMAVVVGGFLAFAAPAAAVWRGTAEQARLCASLTEEGGPFACYDDRMREFVAAAGWSAENLPEEAVVLSRKPRLFFVLSGIRSRAFPLDDDPERFFREAEAADARYVVVDYLDTVGELYLIPVVSRAAGAFCALASWGDPGDVRTELLGIFPLDQREELAVTEDEAGDLVMDLRICPPEMVWLPGRVLPDPASGVIPFLARPEAQSPPP